MHLLHREVASAIFCPRPLVYVIITYKCSLILQVYQTHPLLHTTYIGPSVPNPEVLLTVGEDGQDTQTAEVAWSADATHVPSLPVKPGTAYTLKVPPQQKMVVMKFETFGTGKCLNKLPLWILDT